MFDLYQQYGNVTRPSALSLECTGPMKWTAAALALLMFAVVVWAVGLWVLPVFEAVVLVLVGVVAVCLEVKISYLDSHRKREYLKLLWVLFAPFVTGSFLSQVLVQRCYQTSVEKVVVSIWFAVMTIVTISLVALIGFHQIALWPVGVIFILFILGAVIPLI